MSISKYMNKKWDSTIPLALGDRYYAPDLVRDWRYAQDVVGALANDIMGRLPVKISGGIVTQGAGDTLNITLGRGWVKYSVEIPDTFASFPPSKMSADLDGVPVMWGAQVNMVIASATLNGSTPNYVKVRYAEADGNTRVRAKTAGTYSYETTPSYTFVVDSSAPTAYDLCLASFIGLAGGAFTISSPTISYPVWSEYAILPVGTSIDYSGIDIPSGYLVEDGSSLLNTSYTELRSKLIKSIGACTISNGTPAVVTCNGHNLITGDRIHFTTTGGLPTGLSVSTNYYVIYNDANTFWLASTAALADAGTKLATSSAGSGTHTLFWSPWGVADATHFNIPDKQGISTEGSGQQAYSAWASSEYKGRLGQYRQDKFQGWQVSGTNSTVKWGFLSDNGNAPDFSPAANLSVPNFSTTAKGASGRMIPGDDNTNGTPRTGLSTKTPRVGVWKLIKVI